ncbi:unnamed protein product [Discula destructiva]
MQYVTVLAALLANSVSAASVPRQADDGVWSVTSFLASGAPYSIETTYEFDITDGSVATHCVALESTLPEISYVPLTNCTNPVYSFNFQSAPSNSATPGYNLQVWEEDPTNTVCGAPSTKCVYTGVYFFPASDVVTVTDPSGSGNPNGNFEQLQTAPDFTIPRVGTHI